MLYDASKFSNLLFNPLCEKQVLKTYPSLKEIVPENYQSYPYIDQVIRYVIMMNDPKSILIHHEKDLNHRSQIAADLSKVSKLKEDIVNAVLTYGKIKVNTAEGDVEMDIVLDIATNYLIRFAKSREFSAIVAIEYKFQESIRELRTPILGDTNKERLDAAQKKSVISEEIDKDLKRLEEYYKRFFGEDEQLYKKAVNKIRPEDYAILK